MLSLALFCILHQLRSVAIMLLLHTKSQCRKTWKPSLSVVNSAACIPTTVINPFKEHPVISSSRVHLPSQTWRDMHEFRVCVTEVRESFDRLENSDLLTDYTHNNQHQPTRVVIPELRHYSIIMRFFYTQTRIVEQNQVFLSFLLVQTHFLVLKKSHLVEDI